MTTRILTNLSRRILERRGKVAAQRVHDDAISDARVAGDHATAIDRAVSRGEPGCMFCR